MENTNMVSHMCKYIGETVTVFTESGGESGSGFTGVLLAVNSCYIRLLTKLGPAPACALGNTCDGGSCKLGCGQCYDNCSNGTRVGSEADIPISAIVSFVHNAV